MHPPVPSPRGDLRRAVLVSFAQIIGMHRASTNDLVALTGRPHNEVAGVLCDLTLSGHLRLRIVGGKPLFEIDKINRSSLFAR